MSRSADASNGAVPVTNNANEIGWLFVPQYYTVMNRDPSRLYCFYTKNSALVHATENEEVAPSVGQQDIQRKFDSLHLEDTKVYVSNVDSMSSANGGIVIQVLGEMSNRGEVWRKFAQTFFLAEQPNGYYVLNDIFRFLKDEDATDADAEADAPISASASAAKEAEASVAQSNVPDEKPTGVPTAVQEATAEPPQPQPQEQPQSKPQPSQPSANAKAAAASTAPSAPKTWANLAARNANHWGARTVETRAASESPKPTPANASAKPAAAPKPSKPAATAQVFVKNVSNGVSQDALKASLESHFGPTKECQVNGAKGIAFVEFTSADAARRALSAGSAKVHEHNVVIEPRRTNERGSGSGRGRRGRGGAP